MPKGGVSIHDAWEDDWETQADKAEEQEEEPAPAQQASLTKAERLAQHAESNRKLWQAADAPEEFHYVSSSNNNNVPLATNFKPAMKVLSRKPAPRMIARRDPVTGLEQLTLEDDKDDDDEAKKNQPTPEEIRMRQQKELEEKQRRYEEARAKIFGESTTSSGASTPGNVTPPQNERRPNHRGKGRGRGGHRNDSHSRHDSQTRRPANQQATSSPRELYDPDYSPKPGFALQKRGGGNVSPARPSTPRDEDQIIRGPRGPDSSGRGGFGFARRGAKEG